MNRSRLAFLTLALSAGTARAEPAATATAAPEGQLSLAAHAMLVLPQGDADDFAEESFGGRVTATWSFTPFVAALASFEYVSTNENEDWIPDDYDIHFYALDVGARFTMPRAAGPIPFGEILIGRHTAGVDAPGEDDSESDFGFRLGGGVLVPLGEAARLVAELAYSTAEIEDTDVEAFSLELGLAWAL